MKTLVNYLYESLVLEGGKAVDGTPMTQPIARKIFAELERDFLPKLGLVNRGTDYATLGSFNKKKLPDAQRNVHSGSSLSTFN